MRIHTLCRGVILALWVSLIFSASLCYADDQTVEVVGISECADCAQRNIKDTQAYSGDILYFVFYTDFYFPDTHISLGFFDCYIF